ncbi:hypothetical protein K5549_017278, partial [Capra hircus]
LGKENHSSVSEFILLGFSSESQVRMVLFTFFLTLYFITILGNGLIITLIYLDTHLHTPMYFFLSILSLVDMSYVTTTVPQMLVNLVYPRRTISWGACAAQMFIFLILGIAECVLYAIMAYDRYMAICFPLHYTLLMSRPICIKMVTVCWLISIAGALIYTVFTMRLPYCGPHKLGLHVFCPFPLVFLLLSQREVSPNMSRFSLGKILNGEEFILLGFASSPRTDPLLFTFFLVFYLLILVSNSLLITLIHQDTRLHTPMYFFISVLSMLDVCYTTTTVPQMLVHILSKKRAISFARCVAQMYLFLFCGITEYWLFTIMSIDRYMA